MLQELEEGVIVCLGFAVSLDIGYSSLGSSFQLDNIRNPLPKNPHYHPKQHTYKLYLIYLLPKACTPLNKTLSPHNPHQDTPKQVYLNLTCHICFPTTSSFGTHVSVILHWSSFTLQAFLKSSYSSLHPRSLSHVVRAYSQSGSA